MRGFLRTWRCLLAGAAAIVSAAPCLAAPPPDFDRDVKPILEQNCFKCHGPDKQKAGLRLDQKPSVLKGGESGEPAVVPGNLPKSHLLTLVTTNDPDQAMPPRGDRLKPQEIAVLQRWVETGAHWVDTSKPEPAVEIQPIAADRPITADDRQFWCFVAPRRLPPPQTTTNDTWPRTTIDRYVLARLAAGHLAPSPDAPREMLIRRVTFDLTGLPPTPDEVRAFLADHSPGAYERLVDRLLASPAFGERLASMWLPLARYAEDQAHQVGSDTKFFYPNAWKYREWVVNAFNRDLPYDQFLRFQIAADKFPDATPSDQAALGFIGLGPKYYNRNRLDVMAEEWEDRVDTVMRTSQALTVACARCHDHKFDPISQRDYYALAGVFASTRMINKTPDGKVQKGELKAEELDPATVHVVEDNATPQDLNVFIRGSVTRKGPVVPRRFLSILSPGEPVPFKEGSGRRELALAITDKTNPLTARVIANRLWGLFTGQPIVLTPSNFGHSGQPPSDPQLLDYLAINLMDNNWSIKSLVRQIVLSSVYRQTSAASEAGAKIDPSNELLWRMNRRRMTVEQWRDGVLFASGQLRTGGGKSMELDDPKNLRRTLYARISRLKLNDLLMQFDYPDPNVHAEKRSVTSTPVQKLFVINSPFILSQSKAFAERLTTAGDTDEARIRQGYQILFGRQPTADELSLAIEFLQEPENTKMSRWQQYAQVLLASNEALYVD